jgi:microcystin-dependent protein
MAQPYVGEIRMFAGNFAPQGWAFCSGQLLPISENETLFQLIGTSYGGDGEATFALPDLRGRIPVHQAAVQGYPFGGAFGSEQVTLTQGEVPAHSHALFASSNPAEATAGPNGSLLADAAAITLYAAAPPSVAMHAAAVTTEGGSQPHDNMAPYLCVSFIISLFGIFPTQT